mmetsp:Transcript_48763/g.137243  ORF Transcript_48763/g.137243 Transcript_48763/m.137243 type:complete len:465 (-) Transcript_48763:1965-3359(-)
MGHLVVSGPDRLQRCLRVARFEGLGGEIFGGLAQLLQGELDRNDAEVVVRRCVGAERVVHAHLAGERVVVRVTRGAHWQRRARERGRAQLVRQRRRRTEVDAVVEDRVRILVREREVGVAPAERDEVEASLDGVARVGADCEGARARLVVHHQVDLRVACDAIAVGGREAERVGHTRGEHVDLNRGLGAIDRVRATAGDREDRIDRHVGRDERPLVAHVIRAAGALEHGVRAEGWVVLVLGKGSDADLGRRAGHDDHGGGRCVVAVALGYKELERVGANRELTGDNRDVRGRVERQDAARGRTDAGFHGGRGVVARPHVLERGRIVVVGVVRLGAVHHEVGVGARDPGRAACDTRYHILLGDDHLQCGRVVQVGVGKHVGHNLKLVLVVREELPLVNVEHARGLGLEGAGVLPGGLGPDEAHLVRHGRVDAIHVRQRGLGADAQVVRVSRVERVRAHDLHERRR